MIKTVFYSLFIYNTYYYSEEVIFKERFFRKYWSRQCFFTDNEDHCIFNSNKNALEILKFLKKVGTGMK